MSLLVVFRQLRQLGFSLTCMAIFEFTSALISRRDCVRRLCYEYQFSYILKLELITIINVFERETEGNAEMAYYDIFKRSIFEGEWSCQMVMRESSEKSDCFKTKTRTHIFLLVNSTSEP